MHQQRRVNDSVHLYMSVLCARVVAESGIPSDRYHLGKLILRGLKDAPDHILQIDGALDRSESNRSVFVRSVRCALALRQHGLKKGDVIVLMASNHLDMVIPYYAALYLGVVVSAVDTNSNTSELQDMFTSEKPKLIFCQQQNLDDVSFAVKAAELCTQIVLFGRKARNSQVEDVITFPELLKDFNGTIVDDFKPSDFDPDTTTACIITTSGTTGIPKKAVISHKNFAVTGPYVWSKFSDFPTPTQMVLIVAPVQWMSTMVNFNFSPILRYTRLQSSSPPTQKHVYHLINTYKPTFLVTTTSMMMNLIKPEDRSECDFSCFELIIFGGSSVPTRLIEEIREVMPTTEVFETYSLTEASTYFVFDADYPSLGSCGKPVGHLHYRLMDTQTHKEILVPRVPGELWLKGPGVFKSYYNNPTATKEAFSKDGWFKTGDIFYRDENWNFYFVERLNLLIKYKNYEISPMELENVIRQHPNVYDVCVSSLPDYECTNLVVACVVKKPGLDVTADEIQNIVKDNLEEWQHLKGGVIFLEKIPTTPTAKIDRVKLKEIVLEMKRMNEIVNNFIHPQT